jgi:hypothetical protein
LEYANLCSRITLSSPHFLCVLSLLEFFKSYRLVLCTTIFWTWIELVSAYEEKLKAAKQSVLPQMAKRILILELIIAAIDAFLISAIIPSIDRSYINLTWTYHATLWSVFGFTQSFCSLWFGSKVIQIVRESRDSSTVRKSSGGIKSSGTE